MTEFFLSIGSNINPSVHIPKCLKELKSQFQVTRLSSVYETEAVGIPGSPKFWNMAAAVKTELNRECLDKKMKQLENKLGRVRDPNNKFAPRTIDVDILPQPGYLDYAFIMVPLSEIAPDVKDLETGIFYREIGERYLKTWEGFKKLEIVL